MTAIERSLPRLLPTLALLLAGSSCGGDSPAPRPATIRTQCGDGITDADIQHCISSGFDMPICTGPERGGCMFDVGDMLCPVAAS